MKIEKQSKYSPDIRKKCIYKTSNEQVKQMENKGSHWRKGKAKRKGKGKGKSAAR